jgi:energy-coupling factor transporter ATP-binding protein EcfA2
MITGVANPYVGLRPFETSESILFFGRNAQTIDLLQRLHQHHFVSVVGNSGCGKSSLLRAGLIPALKAGFLVQESDQWAISIMKPGQNPLYNLAQSILDQLDPNAGTAGILPLVQKIKKAGTDALIELITPVYKEKQLNFFLLIDQFEELFRYTIQQDDIAKQDAAIDFVNIMLELTRQVQIPFYVVITMRSDFIGDCSQFYGLPEAMNESQYLVPRLNRLQLKTVIEGPAKLYGIAVKPALSSKLLNDLNKVKDELPLLQHVMMRVWEYEFEIDKSNALDLVDYENVGGIDKALSNHADEALEGMHERELAIAKKLFQALTAIDENGRKIKRPVLLSQLKELTGAGEDELLYIINRFIQEKRSFLVISTDIDSGDKIIDISHESLIRQWAALCEWVDEEADAVSNYLHLAEAASLHQQKKKDFLTGSELLISLDWNARFKPVAAWANRYKKGFDEAIDNLKYSHAQQTSI